MELEAPGELIRTQDGEPLPPLKMFGVQIVDDL